jgi:LytS/YehU family sensor histidine kinase
LNFSSKFSFKINVDKSIEKENTLISPLIIQPYVENAIWHGLMHLEGRKGAILIGFERMNGHMKVSIDDNGIGRKESMTFKEGSRHESMGLTITKERLEIIKMLYKSNMSVNFVDKTDTDGTPLGTRVELIMPYISNTATYA